MRTTENRPLLSESTNSLTSIPISVKEEKTALSPKHSVIGVIGLLCIFLFIILTALFAGLYVKLLKGKPEKYPPFPPPSGTLLGEYAKAAVAADHEMCSEIGRDIMLKGGNAVDAAIATLFCIGVMDTQSAGIGGGHFMTIFNATTKKCHVVDAREMAPAAAFEEMYKNKWDQSKFGWKAVAVTGDVHGLWTEYKNFGGRVSWKTIMQPTIDIMKEGYPTSHALAFALKAFEKGIRKEPSMHRFINPKTNQTYKVGEQIKTRRNLLKTFKLLANASDPVQFLYNSSFTDKIVAEFQTNGGIITKEDFVNYKSIIRDDNDVVYTYLKNGRQICGPPPPSGSAVTQAILNILDGYDDYENVTTFEDYVNLFHRYIEASKFAYAQRSGLGDMKFIKNATDIARNITSSKWAEDVRSKITHETHEDEYYGGNFQALPPDHGTTHIAVIDKWGNAVSVTSTINLVLGAMVMSESSGILWNDQMDDFSSPGHPNYYGYPPTPSNYIRPGKRPMSSTSPIIVYDNKTGETTALGGAGGSTIISGVSFVAMKALWMKKDVKYSIDFPRLHNQLKPNVTTYEKRWPKQYIDALAERGHDMEASSSNITVGNVITSVQKKASGIVYANSDFRKGSESEPAGF